jgi:hypothetical protein
MVRGKTTRVADPILVGLDPEPEPAFEEIKRIRILRFMDQKYDFFREIFQILCFEQI